MPGMKIFIAIHRENGSWKAYCPSMPGFDASSATLKDLLGVLSNRIDGVVELEIRRAERGDSDEAA